MAPSKKRPKKSEPKKKKRAHRATGKAVGRPTGSGGFKPTPEQRVMVEQCCGYRMPEEEICLLIKNPSTNRPISPMTLRKYFADEVRTGYSNLRQRIMAASVRSALGVSKVLKDGTVEIEQQGNVTAQIWLQKTLYGARELVEAVPPPARQDTEDTTLDAARRVAFVMAMGARMVKQHKT